MANTDRSAFFSRYGHMHYHENSSEAPTSTAPPAVACRRRITHESYCTHVDRSESILNSQKSACQGHAPLKEVCTEVPALESGGSEEWVRLQPTSDHPYGY